MTDQTRPPLPPFTPETAALKVRAAEDGWNSPEVSPHIHVVFQHIAQ